MIKEEGKVKIVDEMQRGENKNCLLLAQKTYDNTNWSALPSRTEIINITK